MKQIFLALLAAWATYNLWRVMRSGGNAIEVGAEAVTNVPVEAAFREYMKVREFYLDLSPGHRKYEIAGTSPTGDMIVDIWETAGFQSVRHRYRIAELVENRSMKLVSEKSQVRVLGLFGGVTRSEAEFRFAPLDDAHARLAITIRIVFPNRLRHFLARVFLTEEIWRGHARQEMKALARIIEQRQAAVAQPRLASGPAAGSRTGETR